jgi:hypothetical protein
MFSKWHKWNTSEFVGPIYHDQVNNITRPSKHDQTAITKKQTTKQKQHKTKN